MSQKRSMNRGGNRRPWGRPWPRNRGKAFYQNGIKQPLSESVMLQITDEAMKGWSLYFYDARYDESSITIQRISALCTFFSDQLDSQHAKDVAKNGYFQIEFSTLVNNDSLKLSIPDLKEIISDNAEYAFKCFGLAVYTVISTKVDMPAVIPRVNVRLINCEPLYQLKSIKANLFGKLVTVKGTVIRVTNVKPMVKFLAFKCRSCNSESAVLQPDGIYTVPEKCPVPGCRGQAFIPVRSSPKTKTMDWQTVRIQEILDDDQKDWGRVPRTMDCVLTEDLVDSLLPGDSVILSGIVKILKGDGQNMTRRQDEKTLYDPYIDATSVLNTKRGHTLNRESDCDVVEFTEGDYNEIQQVHSKENVLALLVKSLAPSIYGHDVVKAGLLLTLLGGISPSSEGVQMRGDPHLLIVGDPGLGKSQLLQAVTLAAPRGVYVCGTTTTKSGLTVTLCRESGGSGEYSLEAGALVLADQGICCIDEFDKMTSQHQALLEAMEQQSVSIAKAGIVCSLPARTSVIAAANPHGGHYDKNKTVSENIHLGPALLSRFDMVFILVDRPSASHDYKISKHIIGLHSKNHNSFVPASIVADEILSGREEFIKDKLTTDDNVIPLSLLRKYIAYAKKYVKPILSDEAKRKLQEFYLELRQKAARSGDITAVTTRQLEALIRLAIARAKADLREEVTTEDASDVIEVMKCSLADTATDEFGNLDMRRSQHGSGMSKANQKRRFIATLQSIAEGSEKSIFSVKEMQDIANRLGIDTQKFGDFLNSMNDQGYLLFKGQGKYQLRVGDI
ncbi:DNA helicase MCM8-like isoform X1 [Artemia franciscana]|uniref:DNA helicase MCM8 n=2 Tax=Artemia franciscana TaxID=6661 RepID=A0AA88HV72_ARTSF|nr:hypothetical protein QYM36_009082 [Artemia franciscana]